MQISNDLYFRDRQRHDLALRMIRHEARTRTIRSCTGLTDDRIRRLYKTYRQHQSHVEVRRRRGKSPRQAAYFTRSSELQFEASCLGSVFVAFDLIRVDRRASGDDFWLDHGQRFCDAYETHRQLVLEPHISFEHAWFLLNLLSSGTTLQSVFCRHCGSRYLRDRMNIARRHCPFCERKAAATPCLSASRIRRPQRRRSCAARGAD